MLDNNDKSDEEEDINDEFGDPTYKPGSYMLDFDFEDIDKMLDSDGKSIIVYGVTRKAKKSPPKKGKQKSTRKHDDGGPE